MIETVLALREGHSGQSRQAQKIQLCYTLCVMMLSADGAASYQNQIQVRRISQKQPRLSKKSLISLFSDVKIVCCVKILVSSVDVHAGRPSLSRYFVASQ